MIKSIPVLILAAQLATPVAERGTPQFNTEPTCRGAATASDAIRSTRDVCMQKEKAARDELDKQWASFAAPDRARCVTGTAAGGIPSYVELLTCLEMAKQARNLPKDDPVVRSTTGSGTSPGTSTTGTAPAKTAD